MDAEKIVKEYSDMVYRIAMRYTQNHHDAEDVYSEVFLRYFRKERTFESEEHRKAWLIRVTINCAKDLISKRHTDLSLEAVAHGLPVNEPIQSREDLMMLKAAMESMDATHREVIYMYYIEGMTVSDISRILERPAGTVKSQLSRGREKLRMTY